MGIEKKSKFIQVTLLNGNKSVKFKIQDKEEVMHKRWDDWDPNF